MATEEINIKVKSDISETTKDAAGLAGEFKIMGVSLNSVKGAFASMAGVAKKSFATVKAGIISTGIGALVVAVGSLIAYFTNTKRGADQLKQAMAGLGAVVDVLMDLFSRVGETIFNAFSNPKQAIIDLYEALKTNLMNRVEGFVKGFQALGKVIKAVFELDMEGIKEGTVDYAQALTQVATGMDEVQQKNFANSIKNITTEIKEEVKAMSALEKRTQALRDADNEFMIQKAKTRQEIERARLIAEDETKSAEERLENLKKALDLEAQTTKRELELARERMRIKEQEMALSENSAEDEAELARLKTELIEKETASIKMRRRVVTEVNALEREIDAEKRARFKEKEDEEEKARKKKEKEEEEARKKKEKADKEAAAKKKKADEKAAKEEEDRVKAVEKAKEKLIASGFSAAEKLAGESEGAQKAVAVAKTIYSTQQAIMNTMANVPAPFNLIQAVGTGVMGAAAIQKILSTSSSNATAGGGAASGGGGGTPAPEMMSGAFDLSGVNAPEPVQAYVVTDDMTNSQNKLETIRRRATI